MAHYLPDISHNCKERVIENVLFNWYERYRASQAVDRADTIPTVRQFVEGICLS